MDKEEREAWDLNGNGVIDPDERELLLDNKKEKLKTWTTSAMPSLK